jgi:hypothetical protein
MDVSASWAFKDTRYKGLVGREGLAADRTETAAFTGQTVDAAKNMHDAKPIAWRVYCGTDTLTGGECGGTDRTNLGNVGTYRSAERRRSVGSSLFIVTFCFGPMPQKKPQTE